MGLKIVHHGKALTFFLEEAKLQLNVGWWVAPNLRTGTQIPSITQQEFSGLSSSGRTPALAVFSSLTRRHPHRQRISFSRGTVRRFPDGSGQVSFLARNAKRSRAGGSRICKRQIRTNFPTENRTCNEATRGLFFRGKRAA